MLLMVILFSILSCEKQENLTDPKGVIGRNSLPHTKAYPSDIANVWFNTLTEVVKAKPYFSSQAIRIFAYSGLALYESVVPGMPSRPSYLRSFTGSGVEVNKKKDYFWPACANAAVFRVASRIMSAYPSPDLRLLVRVEDSIRRSFPKGLSDEQLQASIDFGNKVADLIFDWSMKDGSFNASGGIAECPPYIPGSEAGSWQPTPPGFFSAAGACQGSLRSFTKGITELLPKPHPVYSVDKGSAFYRAAEEVYSRNQKITEDEKQQFENWRDNNTYYIPVSHPLRIAAALMDKEEVNLEDASLLYLKMTVASHDAVIAAFHAKYVYKLIRPVTYIRSVLGHSNWLSRPITPQTPSYPDEMAATAASVRVLEGFFGQNYSFTDSTNKRQIGKEWRYNSFDSMLGSIVEARVSAGTTFRFCGEEGISLGRKVGETVERLPF